MNKADITVNENSLIESIKEIILTSRKNIVRSVNTEMLSAYWNIGRLIVEDEQKNQERAQYGEQTLKHISKRSYKSQNHEKVLPCLQKKPDTV